MDEFRNFVVKNINLEGHCEFYEPRKVLWESLICKDSFGVLLSELKGLFDREKKNLESVLSIKKIDDQDGSVIFRTAWGKAVHGSGVLQTVADILGVGTDDIHLQCIVASIQRHVFLYCSREAHTIREEEHRALTEPETPSSDTVDTTIGAGRGRGRGRP